MPEKKYENRKNNGAMFPPSTKSRIKGVVASGSFDWSDEPGFAWKSDAAMMLPDNKDSNKGPDMYVALDCVALFVAKDDQGNQKFTKDGDAYMTGTAKDGSKITVFSKTSASGHKYYSISRTIETKDKEPLLVQVPANQTDGEPTMTAAVKDAFPEAEPATAGKTQPDDDYNDIPF